MSNPSDTDLVVTREFNCSPEILFTSWLDANFASKWLFATPKGEMVIAESDPVVGGAFLYVDRRDGVDARHIGQYTALDRPHHLGFTFSVPQYSEVVTTVNLDFEPSRTGCKITLTHKDVLEEWRDQTRQGWQSILQGLASALGD